MDKKVDASVTRVATRIKPRVSVGAYREKTRAAGLNDAGQLIPDPTPIAPPVGYRRQESMVEIVRRMVRDERLAAELAAADMETFEEADDFDVGDDGTDLTSGFENDFDPPVREIAEEVALARKPAPEAPAAAVEAVEPTKLP